jgi:hypothetical protein
LKKVLKMDSSEQFKEVIRYHHNTLQYLLIIIKALLLKSAGFNLTRTLMLLSPQIKVIDLEKLITRGINGEKILLLLLKKIRNIDIFPIITEYFINNKIDIEKVTLFLDKLRMDIDNYLNKMDLYLASLIIVYYFIPILVILLIIFWNINAQYLLFVFILAISFIWNKFTK